MKEAKQDCQNLARDVRSISRGKGLLVFIILKKRIIVFQIS